MTVSLYDLSVASYLQTLGGTRTILDKGLAHCRATGIDPHEVVESQIHPDMRPFRFQVQSVAFHSLGAIHGLQRGWFSPSGPRPAHDYAALQDLIAETISTLQAFTSGEINGLAGGDMVFRAGERERPFTAEGFILSFSLPNFYFHAATAYDILRAKGVPLGKSDYTGALRVKI